MKYLKQPLQSLLELFDKLPKSLQFAIGFCVIAIIFIPVTCFNILALTYGLLAPNRPLQFSTPAEIQKRTGILVRD